MFVITANSGVRWLLGSRRILTAVRASAWAGHKRRSLFAPAYRRTATEKMAQGTIRKELCKEKECEPKGQAWEPGANAPRLRRPERSEDTPREQTNRRTHRVRRENKNPIDVNLAER
ncbi:MAG: hypothetical protein JKX93_04555 [Rhizobiaceae bacterium]|nr:hypothetical protein [Rhizobiaceae bacterium]